LEEATAKYKSHFEKLKKEKQAREAEKKDLQHQLENVNDQGYWWGCEESIEFLRGLLVTLAPGTFRVEGYFEAYVKYVDELRQVEAERRDPESVEFYPSGISEDGPGNEDYTSRR